MGRIVVLVRHATAENPAAGGDRLRPLTDQGRLDARQLGEFLASRIRAARIVCSPILRARETAELIATQTRWPLRESARLSTGATAEDFEAEIEAESPADEIIVAHNPEIGMVASQWSGTSLGFAPGSAAAFEFGDRIRLLWTRHP